MGAVVGGTPDLPAGASAPLSRSLVPQHLQGTMDDSEVQSVACTLDRFCKMHTGTDPQVPGPQAGQAVQ